MSSWAEYAGETEGLRVWRIEHFEPKHVPHFDGTVYDGNAYIFLHTFKTERNQTLHHDIFFWLGKEARADEVGAAALRSMELDDAVLGHDAPQHREVQGNETADFLALFDASAGLTFSVKKGGEKTAFNHAHPTAQEEAEEREAETRLIRVAGKFKKIQLYEYPVSVESLSNAHVFVLDAVSELFQFNGARANVWEKRAGADLVASLKEERSLPCGSVCVVDGADDADAGRFWERLGCSGGAAVRDGDDAAADGAPVSLDEAAAGGLVVRRVAADLASVEADALPARRSTLSSEDAFVVDCGRRVYVWTGARFAKKAELRARFQEVARAYLSGAEAGRGGRRTLRNTPVKTAAEGRECASFVGLFAEEEA
eukprot:Rhum_TRINITY_DN14432_c24_g1::Rhum_TRINITY_DN14432_c24_g1_i1::g.91081::m.91081/K05768/GSN; gelsolin